MLFFPRLISSARNIAATRACERFFSETKEFPSFEKASEKFYVNVAFLGR